MAAVIDANGNLLYYIEERWTTSIEHDGVARPITSKGNIYGDDIDYIWHNERVVPNDTPWDSDYAKAFAFGWGPDWLDKKEPRYNEPRERKQTKAEWRKSMKGKR